MNLSDHDTGEEDGSDENLHTEEKKRRLTFEQVKTLEKSFEKGNKLEVERKLQLAKALGLQPRQIAVWFQNRRARSKTKQVEEHFDALKQEYVSLKRKHEILLAENRQFKAEVQRLSREPENNYRTSRVSGSKIESQHKSANSVLKPTNTPMELSVKLEICKNCTEPVLDISPTTTNEQENGCYSIMSEPTSSGCNIDSPRTIQSPHSLRDPQTACVGNNSSPLPLEGSSVAGARKILPPVHEKLCLPNVAEVDSAWFNQAEETCCTLFHSLDEQSAVMLWEYWHLADE